MPMDRKRYPANWEAIALCVKRDVGWKCQKCNTQCLAPSDSTTELSKSDRAKLTLTVHHLDLTPENNDPSNLIALCSGCHLQMHQHRRGNVTPGQLSIL
jgi:5-methylcytosine-specific restriction endonuclease McrA